MDKHNITVEKSKMMPYDRRIEKLCRLNNAYIYYKTNRTDILLDKEGKQVNTEPFHIKMLRDEEE